MPAKTRQKLYLENPVLAGLSFDAGRSTTPGTAAGLKHRPRAAALRRERYVLEDVVVAVDADDDFGSVKLCDLPDGTLLLVGAVVALTAAAAGGITLASADVAVGTAAASAATLATTMLDVVPKIDVTAGGVVAGGSTATEALQVLAASSDALYLNVGGATITADGTLTFNGFIDVVFVDLGA